MSAPASATPEAKPIAKRGRLAATRAGSLLMRLLLGACGVGLVVGFFMRWMTVGDILAVSGFGLMVTQGDAIALLSGAHRFVLLEVPLFGLLLVIGAFVGHRLVLWIALLSGLGVLGFGLFTVVRLFFQTTGLGMWVVVASAFLAFGLSLIGLSRTNR